jgi:cell division protein FtsB
VTLANGPIEGGGREPEPEGGGGRSRLRLLLLGMASLVLTLGAVFGRHGLLELRQFRLERDRMATENARLEKENAALAADVEALRSDPLAIERVAREQLGLVRPGEKLILLAPEERHDEPLRSTSPGLDAPPERP